MFSLTDMRRQQVLGPVRKVGVGHGRIERESNPVQTRGRYPDLRKILETRFLGNMAVKRTVDGDWEKGAVSGKKKQTGKHNLSSGCINKIGKVTGVRSCLETHPKSGIMR